jgi:hypothetical protein
LTHLATTYSMAADGGLPSDCGGVGSALQLGAGVSGLSVPASMAGGISLSPLRRRQSLAVGFDVVAVCELRPPSIGYGRNDLPGYAHPADSLVPGDVVGDRAEERRQRSGAAAGAEGLGSYQTAWAWLHKLRRAMVRPSRDRLQGRVEVDETYLGGLEEGMRGRQTARKALIVVAAQEEGRGIGRIRMRCYRGRFGRELDAVCAGLHRTGERRTHGRVVGLRTPGKEGLPPSDHLSSRSGEICVRSAAARSSSHLTTEADGWAPIRAPSVSNTWTITSTSLPTGSIDAARAAGASCFSGLRSKQWLWNQPLTGPLSRQIQAAAHQTTTCRGCVSQVDTPIQANVGRGLVSKRSGYVTHRSMVTDKGPTFHVA